MTKPVSDDEDFREDGRALPGSQTLTRGLELVAAVAHRSLSLGELAEQVGLTRSTVHRLASALVEHRYLKLSRGAGYSLGPRLLELGYLASRQASLPRVARDHIELLAASTLDTVYLGVLEGNRALYLDKIPGSRRVEVAAGVGERLPLRSTGLGKALILDDDEKALRQHYEREVRHDPNYGVPWDLWIERMREYAGGGYALDLEENGDHIRCVAAPIRDVTGAICGALSVATAAQYMDDTRVRSLVPEVKAIAERISRELGYSPAPSEISEAPTKRRGSRKTPSPPGEEAQPSSRPQRLDRRP